MEKVAYPRAKCQTWTPPLKLIVNYLHLYVNNACSFVIVDPNLNTVGPDPNKKERKRGKTDGGGGWAAEKSKNQLFCRWKLLKSSIFWFSAGARCGKPVISGFPLKMVTKNLYFRVFRWSMRRQRCPFNFEVFLLSFLLSFCLGRLTGWIHWLRVGSRWKYTSMHD